MNKLLYTALLLCLFSGFAQDMGSLSPEMQDLINRNNSGFLEFDVLKSESTIGAGIFGLAGQKIPAPLIESFKSDGGTVLVIEEDFEERCTNGKQAKTGLNMWVMYLDETNPFNSFKASKKDKKASLQIRGTMDRYEPGPNFCENLEMVKVESGLGAMSVNFSTYLHTSPRQFQVLEQASYQSEKMKQLKAVQAFWRANIMGYLKYMKEYKAKPHISRIGGNGNQPPPPPPPAQREPVKAGTEDGEEEGWFSQRDGFAIAKHAIDALSTSIDAIDLAGNGAKLFGAALKYGGSVKKAALDVVASAANLAGLDVNSMSEEHIYQTIDMMVAAYAKNNEKYANNGNAVASELERKSKIPVNDKRYYKEAVDTGRMLYQLNDMFNDLDAAEEELAAIKYPEGAVSGKIYGPGLNQNITSWKIEGQPVITIANSTALEESKAMASPQMLNELKDMGYDIPEEILNMDIDAMLEKAQAGANGKIDIDLEAPLLNGIMSTTHTVNIQGNKIQNYLIIFAVSSPNEATTVDWFTANTIFTGGSNDETEKPKSKKLYLAVDGNDSNPGTEEAPFATMQRALEESLVHRQNKKAVTIYVADGVYRQSAEVDWTTSLGLPPLNIQAANKHSAIFIGSEPVDPSVHWTPNLNKEIGGWTAPLPLHQEQWTYTPGGNPMSNPAPVLSINDKMLFHLAALPPQAKGFYSFGTTQITVGAPQGVDDMNNLTNIEISTRKYAIKIRGGGPITINGLRFQNYPYPAPNNTPGVDHDGTISLLGCKFQ
ncbi:MAG: hypothetical protein DWP94_14625 [Flavobacterium sp.]|nr:MAG: hypothetical protein DWP94_14625 [Flavobacterium sp.]